MARQKTITIAHEVIMNRYRIPGACGDYEEFLWAERPLGKRTDHNDVARALDVARAFHGPDAFFKIERDHRLWLGPCDDFPPEAKAESTRLLTSILRQTDTLRRRLKKERRTMDGRHGVERLLEIKILLTRVLEREESDA